MEVKNEDNLVQQRFGFIKNPSSGYEEDTKVKIVDIANVDNKYLALSAGFKFWCVVCLVVSWGLTYSNILLYFIL